MYCPTTPFLPSSCFLLHCTAELLRHFLRVLESSVSNPYTRQAKLHDDKKYRAGSSVGSGFFILSVEFFPSLHQQNFEKFQNSFEVVQKSRIKELSYEE
jgi:hypothetical protein